MKLNDETCRWITFDDDEPIAVMRCVCGRHPDVDDEGVACGLCGRRSPVRSRDIIAAIEEWNEMVDPGE